MSDSQGPIQGENRLAVCTLIEAYKPYLLSI
jgi:hypothetical protein